MPEAGGSNIEIAKHLTEHEESEATPGHAILEIVEALVLAIVAIATAWSGYQAALWTGHQSELYGQASKLRVQAEGAANAANQERLYNASTVVEWLKAEAQGQKKLSDLFERRFLPEFRPAFDAWRKTDPLNNPNAPAGPQLMVEYRSSRTEEAVRLNNQATEVFEQGTRAGNRRPIRASHRHPGNRLVADCHQPAFQDSGCAGCAAVDCCATAMLSRLPHSYVAESIETLPRPGPTGQREILRSEGNCQL
jgi:hypothetical protein